MILLAIDTVTEMCSAALSYNGAVIMRSQKVERTHSEIILPMIDDILSEAGLTLGQTDAIVFDRGPGSFTGIRITASVAQGLAWASDLPLVPVSSLATLAQGVYRDRAETNVLTCIDARKAEVYWACYERQAEGDWKNAGEFVTSASDIHANVNISWYGVGSGWLTYYQELCDNNSVKVHGYNGNAYPLAGDMLPIARQAYIHNQIVSPEQALPVYLRDEVATPSIKTEN